MSFHSLYKRWNKFEKKILSRLDSTQKRLWDVFVFLMRFMLLAIPFNFLIWLNFDAYPLQILTAKLVSYLLSLSGIVTRVDEHVITAVLAFGEWKIEIIRDCIGWKSFMAAAGLMFAVRGVKMRKRIIGMALSAPIIYAGNILRIYSSIFVPAIYGSSQKEVLDMFNTIHEILWQGGLIALVIAIWWIWMNKYAYNTDA